MNAIREMQAERVSLVARLALVDDAIEKVRAAFDVPPLARVVLPPAADRRVKPRPAVAAITDVLPVEIRDVLQQRGPMAPGALAAKARTTLYYVTKYVKQGLLVSSGETTARLISLPGQALAKEEP